MRLRSVAGDIGPEDVGLELFDRSATTWRRLGAPADLYDMDVAAARAAEMAPTGYGLDGLEREGFDSRQLRRLLAKRHWAWARPAFLAEVGALTAEERDRMARWPKLHARPGGGE